MRRQFLVALAGPTRGGFRTAGPGALAALAETISAQGINIRAIGGAEIGGTGGLALMVNDDQEDGLEQLLRSAGYTAVEVESVEVELEDRPGALAEVARRIADAGVNRASGISGKRGPPSAGSRRGQLLRPSRLGHLHQPDHEPVCAIGPDAGLQGHARA